MVTSSGAAPESRSPSRRELARERALASAAAEDEVAIASRRLRIAGLIVCAIGIALSWLTVGDIAAGIRSHPTLVVAGAPAAIAGGLWFAAVGLGNAEQVSRPPPWVLLGGAIAAVVGAAIAPTFFVWLAELWIGWSS